MLTTTTARDDDPMWLVAYSAKSSHQGETAVYVPRSTLPTDDQCDALFSAMATQGNGQWALGMRPRLRQRDENVW